MRVLFVLNFDHLSFVSDLYWIKTKQALNKIKRNDWNSANLVIRDFLYRAIFNVAHKFMWYQLEKCNVDEGASRQGLQNDNWCVQAAISSKRGNDQTNYESLKLRYRSLLQLNPKSAPFFRQITILTKAEGHIWKTKKEGNVQKAAWIEIREHSTKWWTKIHNLNVNSLLKSSC